MSGKPVSITSLNFENIINSNSLALVDFWAPWCAPCRIIAPIIEDLAKKYVERIIFGKVEVDKNPEMAERFRIFSIPTLVLIKDGKEVKRIVGLVSKSHIESNLEEYLK